MKLLILITAIIVAPFSLLAQSNDAQFNSALEETRNTEKLLLVAHYDSQSALDNNNVFGNRHVDLLMNEHFFVHQTVDKRGSKQDATYPIYLVYNQEGSLIHHIAGEEYPYEFIVKVKKALQPNAGYPSLINRFEQGANDVVFLETLLGSAADAGDYSRTPQFMEAYIDALAGNYTPNTLRNIVKYTRSSENPGFLFLMDNMTVVTAELGEEIVVDRLAEIIFNEEFSPHLSQRNVDVKAIVAATHAQYPLVALQKSIAGMELEFLERNQDWSALADAIPAFMQRYGDSVTSQQAGYYTWLMDEHAPQKKGLLAVNR